MSVKGTVVSKVFTKYFAKIIKKRIENFTDIGGTCQLYDFYNYFGFYWQSQRTTVCC